MLRSFLNLLKGIFISFKSAALAGYFLFGLALFSSEAKAVFNLDKAEIIVIILLVGVVISLSETLIDIKLDRQNSKNPSDRDA